jgi:hypothetical protein
MFGNDVSKPDIASTSFSDIGVVVVGPPVISMLDFIPSSKKSAVAVLAKRTTRPYQTYWYCSYRRRRAVFLANQDEHRIVFQ